MPLAGALVRGVRRERETKTFPYQVFAWLCSTQSLSGARIAKSWPARASASASSISPL